MATASTDQSSTISTVVVIIGFIIGGIYYFDARQKQKDCEARALAAAVETYPPGNGMTVAQRQVKQEDYVRSYRLSC